MSKKVYGNIKGFGLIEISTGEFIDEGCLITAHTVRLSPEALNAWHTSKAYEDPEDYDSRQEWEAYKAEKDRLREEWQRKVKRLIGLGDDNDRKFFITQNVSEIFTIVTMERV